MDEYYSPTKLSKTGIAKDFGTVPEAVGDHFRKSILTIHEGRHLNFVKIAGTQAANPSSENEAEVYKRNFPLPEGIVLPEFVEEGFYQEAGQEYHWIKTRYIPGNELYSLTTNAQNPKEIDVRQFQEHLPQIAQGLVAVMQWRGEGLPLDKKRDQSVAVTIKEKVVGWIQERLSLEKIIPDSPENIKQGILFAHKLQEMFFQSEEQVQQRLQLAACAGDADPNMFRFGNDGKLYLMDMEHARLEWIKFYDAAYLYHRLYTKYQRQDIAEQFLEEFFRVYTKGKRLSKKDREAFRFALAERVIGGYFDAVEDGVTKWDLQNELAEKVLHAENSLTELLGR